MGFKSQGQLERGFNASLVKRETDTLGGGRIQARMVIVSNGLGLGVAQRGSNTPGLQARNLAWLHYCPAE